VRRWWQSGCDEPGAFTLASPTVIVVQRVLTTWEVGIVRQRLLQACSVTALGLALAVAPMAAASASSHKAKHHPKAKHHTTTTTKPKSKSTKGALAPGNKLCVEAASGDSSSGDVGSNLEKAMISAEQSGNFDAAKPAMIASINASLKEEGPAEAALSGAPSNVQAAMKGLFAYVQSYETAINNAQSFTQFATSMESLIANSQIQNDADTLANYLHTECGTPLPPTVDAPAGT
jgi:hypothetical protein